MPACRIAALRPVGCPETAARLGVVGLGCCASGHAIDARPTLIRATAAGAKVVSHRNGDVAARIVVRFEERSSRCGCNAPSSAASATGAVRPARRGTRRIRPGCRGLARQVFVAPGRAAMTASAAAIHTTRRGELAGSSTR